MLNFRFLLLAQFTHSGKFRYKNSNLFQDLDETQDSLHNSHVRVKINLLGRDYWERVYFSENLENFYLSTTQDSRYRQWQKSPTATAVRSRSRTTSRSHRWLPDPDTDPFLSASGRKNDTRWDGLCRMVSFRSRADNI